MTKKELVDRIMPYDDDMEVRVYGGNFPVVHISNNGNKLIIADKKPVGTCNRCSSKVFKTVNYVYCPVCEEELYPFEFERDKDAIKEGDKVKFKDKAFEEAYRLFGPYTSQLNDSHRGVEFTVLKVKEVGVENEPNIIVIDRPDTFNEWAEIFLEKVLSPVEEDVKHWNDRLQGKCDE